MQKSATFHAPPVLSVDATQPVLEKSFSKILKKTVLAFSVAASVCFPGKRSEAQQLQFTSVPVTAAVENVTYTCPVMATISNNEKIDFSANNLPSWLTLSNSGGASGTKINNTAIPNASGVALDANGNYYVVQQGSNGIYKVTPDGTTTLWASKRSNSANYGAIVVGNYLYVSYYYASENVGIERFDITQTSPVPEIIYTTTGVLSMTYKDGYLYGANYSYGKVIRIKLSDKSVTDYIPVIQNCFGLGFTPSGDLLVADYGALKVRKYSNGVLTDIITGLPASPTDVKIDANGYVYISMWPGKIRKYTPDYTSFVEVSSTSLISMSMTMTSTGILVYGDISSGNVYALQTGAVLTGTPSHKDVGQYPVKITATSGSVSTDQEFVITVTDPNPPKVVKYEPVNNASEIELNTPVKLHFNEEIVKGTGNIYIKSYLTNDTLQTIDITSSNVSVSDTTLSVSVSGLPVYTHLYIAMDSAAIKDIHNNAFAGIKNSATWSFVTISKTQQAITFATSNSVVYGAEDYAPGATSNSGLDITYASSDNAVTSIVDGKIHIKKAGLVTITASQAGNNDYLPATPVEQQLTISKKEITVSVAEAPAISKLYDGTRSIVVAAENYVISGVIGEEDVKITGTALFSDANAGSDKTITVNDFIVDGADKDNYRLSTEFATTKGSVGKKQITLALNATPAISKTYDGAATASLAASNYSLSGVVGSDEVTVTGTAAYGDKNAGTSKTITVNTFVLNGNARNNYSLTTTSATVAGAILKKDITIVAHAKNKVYGAADPQFTYDVTGLVTGEQMSGSLSRENNKNVGQYTITIGTLSAGANYNVSGYTNASLTITPAPLTITAEDKTKEQGKANPELTFKYDGLVAGDVPADLTGQPQAQTSAVALSPIGYYDIIAGGAASANYTITMVNGKLSVLPSGNTHVKVWSSSASQLQIRVYSETAQKATLLLYTQSGQPLVQESKQLQPGINSFSMSVGNFSSGIYILNVHADKFKEAQRVKIK